MILKFAAFFLLLFSFIPANAQKTTADLIVTNANVRTMDESNPTAQAFAVVDGKIVAVGNTSKIKQFTGANTKTIDAGGKLVLPGFNDAHVHFSAMGGQFFSVDLRDSKSLAEVIEKVKFYARFLPKGLWILGGGWNNTNWMPNDLPSKDLIDSAAPEHPVFLYHSNPKIAIANSLALKIARIDKSAKTAFESGIIRDADGEPTGILKDSAVNFVRSFAPQFTTDRLLFAETASNYAAAFGVTSVQDVSADDGAEIYRGLARQGKLKTRVYDCIALSDWAKLARGGVKRADGDALVRRGCLKGVADGDADSTEGLYEEILAADRANLQVAVHAIGARSIAQILSVFERVTKTNGKKDRRFRVEHAHSFYPQDVSRFANYGIIASVQPYLFSDNAGRTFDPLRDLIRSGAPLAFGSDATMVSVNPLLGIAAAVNAADPKQKITVEEAVRFYTFEAAYAEFQENEKGAITVGKLADFVILSDDIFSINSNQISQTRVLTTIMDGKIVYQAN